MNYKFIPEVGLQYSPDEHFVQIAVSGEGSSTHPMVYGLTNKGRLFSAPANPTTHERDTVWTPVALPNFRMVE